MPATVPAQGKGAVYPPPVRDRYSDCVSAAIRPVQLTDQAVVGDIAYATGFFGGSAARYFPAQTLFKALWVGPYFHGAGFAGFVAEVDGQVVGYVLGSPDWSLYRPGLWRAIPAALASRSSLPDVLASLPYLMRATWWRATHADPHLYPAHLHLNLLPEARGHYLGERLLRAHLTTLAGAGVPGVQFSTTTENEAALGLYRKLGFQVLHTRPTSLWEPWLGRETTQVVMGLELRDLCRGAGSEESSDQLVDD